MTSLPPENHNTGSNNANGASDPNGGPGYGEAPYTQNGYQNPAPGQPAAAAAVPPQVNRLLLNYWLSVFFHWLPALIFFLVDRGKDYRADQLNASNLNFSLLRVIAGIGGVILMFIPFIGAILYILVGLTLTVFHVVAAVKVTKAYYDGQGEPFVFNAPMVRV